MGGSSSSRDPARTPTNTCPLPFIHRSLFALYLPLFALTLLSPQRNRTFACPQPLCQYRSSFLWRRNNWDLKSPSAMMVFMFPKVWEAKNNWRLQRDTADWSRARDWAVGGRRKGRGVKIYRCLVSQVYEHWYAVAQSRPRPASPKKSIIFRHMREIDASCTPRPDLYVDVCLRGTRARYLVEETRAPAPAPASLPATCLTPSVMLKMPSGSCEGSLIVSACANCGQTDGRNSWRNWKNRRRSTSPGYASHRCRRQGE